MSSFASHAATRAAVDGLMPKALDKVDASVLDPQYREYIAAALDFAAFAWQGDEKEREGLYPYLHDVEGPAKLLCFLDYDADSCEITELRFAYMGLMDVTALVEHMKDDIESAAWNQLLREREQSDFDNRIPSEAY